MYLQTHIRREGKDHYIVEVSAVTLHVMKEPQLSLPELPSPRHQWPEGYQNPHCPGRKESCKCGHWNEEPRIGFGQLMKRFYFLQLQHNFELVHYHHNTQKCVRKATADGLSAPRVMYHFASTVRVACISFCVTSIQIHIHIIFSPPPPQLI